MKTVLRGMFIAVSSFIKKLSVLKLCFKSTHERYRKKETNAPKRRQQEITKLRAKINQLETEQYKELRKPGGVFLKINKIHTPSAKLSNSQRVPKLTKSKMERGT